MLKKDINFGCYTKAEILKVQNDGTILCNLYGSRLVNTQVYDSNGEFDGSIENYEDVSDTNISFKNGTVLTLTDNEIKLLKSENVIANGSIP